MTAQRRRTAAQRKPATPPKPKAKAKARVEVKARRKAQPRVRPVKFQLVFGVQGDKSGEFEAVAAVDIAAGLFRKLDRPLVVGVKAAVVIDDGTDDLLPRETELAIVPADEWVEYVTKKFPAAIANPASLEAAQPPGGPGG